MSFKTLIKEASKKDNIKKHMMMATNDIERWVKKINDAIKNDNMDEIQQNVDYISSALKDITHFSVLKDLKETNQQMEIYKEIKNKKGYQATFLPEDFKVTDSFNMKLSNGTKIKVLLNTTDFNKPVYWFEIL